MQSCCAATRSLSLLAVRRATASLGAADALPLRLLCRDTLAAVGALRKVSFSSRDLLMASDPLNGFALSSPQEASRQAEESPELPEPKVAGVLLRCLVLLGRLTAKLMEAQSHVSSEPVRRLQQVHSDIETGRLATVHAFSEQVRAATAEVLAFAEGQLPVLSRIVSDFEAELIRINVAEVEYANFRAGLS